MFAVLVLRYAIPPTSQTTTYPEWLRVVVMGKRFVRGIALVLCGLMVMGCASQGTPLTVRAEGSELAYQPATLRVAAGSTVVLTFENNSAFSHNFILVNGDEATLLAVDAAGDAAGDAGGYIPVGVPGMIAQSALLVAGTTEVVTFVAPAAGTYIYFCTYPAHLEGGMRGVLTVE